MADEDFTPEELELLDEMIADLKAINQRMIDMIERDKNGAARFNQLMAQIAPSTTPLNSKTKSISNIASAGEKNSCTELVLIDLTPLKPSPSEAESTMVMEQKEDQLEDPVEESLDLVPSKREVQVIDPLNNGGLVAAMGKQLLQPFVPINQHTKCTSSNFVPGVFISNRLLDLYTKCGSLVDAQKVFDEMGNRDLCLHWVIITGLDSIEPLLAQTDEFQLLLLAPVSPRLPPKPPDVSYCTVGFSESSHSRYKMNHSVIPIYRPFLQSLFSQSVTVFDELWKLEPLSEERKSKWRREMDWLLSPTNYMVELFPTKQSGASSRMFEIMTLKARADIHMNLPALQKLDSMLIEALDLMVNTEFWYAEGGSRVERRNTSARQSKRWWLPSPQVPRTGTETRRLLHHRRVVCQVFKAVKSINENVLLEMPVPANIKDALAKSGKENLGEELHKVLTAESSCGEDMLKYLNLRSEHSALETINRLEAAIFSWKERIVEHVSGKSPIRASRSFVKDTMSETDKMESLLDRAETLLLLLKTRYPHLPQTFLDATTVQYGKDIGQSILEAYSRVLGNLAFNILSRIRDIMQEDSISNPNSPLVTSCSPGINLSETWVIGSHIKHSLLDKMNMADGKYCESSSASNSDIELSSIEAKTSSVIATPIRSRVWCIGREANSFLIWLLSRVAMLTIKSHQNIVVLINYIIRNTIKHIVIAKFSSAKSGITHAAIGMLSHLNITFSPTAHGSIRTCFLPFLLALLIFRIMKSMCCSWTFVLHLVGLNMGSTHPKIYEAVQIDNVKDFHQDMKKWIGLQCDAASCFIAIGSENKDLHTPYIGAAVAVILVYSVAFKSCSGHNLEDKVIFKGEGIVMNGNTTHVMPKEITKGVTDGTAEINQGHMARDPKLVDLKKSMWVRKHNRKMLMSSLKRVTHHSLGVWNIW